MTAADHTPPETSGPTTEVGTLGGLPVTAQAITTIEDEVRVAIPDAHVEVTFLAYDLSRSDPANLVTRLERHLHRRRGGSEDPVALVFVVEVDALERLGRQGREDEVDGAVPCEVVDT